jgi:hypothetical protein
MLFLYTCWSAAPGVVHEHLYYTICSLLHNTFFTTHIHTPAGPLQLEPELPFVCPEVLKSEYSSTFTA